MDKFGEKIFEVIAATAPLVLAYFAGIAYLSAYLSRFSISLHEIDLPIPIVLSYSFNVFSNPVFIGIVLAIGVAAFAMLCSPPDEKYATAFSTRRGLTVVIIFGVVIGGLVISKVAQIAADQRSQKILNGEAAWVSFKAPLSKYDFDLAPAMLVRLMKCKTKGQFLHVLTTEKYTYAVCLVTSREGLLIVQSNDGSSILPLREFER